MIFGIVIAFLFIYAGLRTTSSFIILAFQWKRSQEWLATRGKIIQSDLQSIIIVRGSNFNGPSKFGTVYTPNILYKYRANAEAFQSNQIFLGQSFPTNIDTANDLLEQYPIDKEVTVYFNPEKPDSSVLEQEWHKELFGYLIGGTLYLLLGFVILDQVIHEPFFRQ